MSGRSICAFKRLFLFLCWIVPVLIAFSPLPLFVFLLFDFFSVFHNGNRSIKSSGTLLRPCSRNNTVMLSRFIEPCEIVKKIRLLPRASMYLRLNISRRTRASFVPWFRFIRDSRDKNRYFNIRKVVKRMPRFLYYCVCHPLILNWWLSIIIGINNYYC